MELADYHYPLSLILNYWASSQHLDYKNEGFEFWTDWKENPKKMKAIDFEIFAICLWLNYLSPVGMYFNAVSCKFVTFHFVFILFSLIFLFYFIVFLITKSYNNGF